MGNTFARDIERFTNKTSINMDTVVRKVTFELYRDVVRLTPVDTGHARANWQIGIGFRPMGTIDAADRNSASSIARESTKLSQIKAGGLNYITNNVNYTLCLEYGTSKQAPQGMARVTVERFQNHVNAIIRSMK